MVNLFFAWAPWVGIVLIIGTTFAFTRGHTRSAAVPTGQTFACNNCGHRSKRDHMVPVAREGTVMWYCQRCAAKV